MATPAERPHLLTKLCRENPRAADDLRQLYSMVRDMPLTQSLDAAALGARPERLGDFRLISKIGGGGMGVVYLAEQESLERTVALKIIRPELLYFPRTKKRFLQEGKALAALKHPNIVPVYATGEVDGIPYIAMEWVEGRTVAEILLDLSDREGAGPSGSDFLPCEDSYERACLQIASQVAVDLTYAHSRGIVHRDVKPSNLIITKAGQVKLLDFGLAQSPESDCLTTCGSDEGSLAYMPPERLRGEDKQADVRSDVYSLGVTLYEMLVRKLPFHGTSRENTRELILKGRVPPLSRRGIKVSWEAETVCLKAIALDPRHRYADAQALAKDLNNARALKPLQARRPGTVRRVHRWSQRNRLASAFLLFLLFATAVTMVLAINAEQARVEALADKRVTKATTSILSGMLTAAVQRRSTAAGQDESLMKSLLWALASVQDRYKKHPEAEAAVRLAIARTLAPLGAHEKAYEEAERSFEINRHVVGEQSPESLDSIRTMAWIASLQGHDELAYSLAKTSVEMSIAIHGKWHPITFARRNYFTKVLERSGRHDQALVHAQEVLRDCNAHLTKTMLPTLGAAREYGLRLLVHGRPRKALALTREYLPIAQDKRGEEDLETLKLRRLHARALARIGRHKVAEQHFRAILDINIRIHGAKSTKASFARRTLADFLTHRGRWDEARALLLESLEAARSMAKAIGGQKRKLKEVFLQLAELELAAKRFEEAEDWCRKSIAYCVNEVQRKSAIHLLLIKILLKSGDASRALAYAKDQIRSLAEINGPQGTLVIDFRLRLVRLLKSSGQTSLAYRACQDCLAILSEAPKNPLGDLQVQLLEAENLEKTLALALNDD